jgi:hypothetical protein
MKRVELPGVAGTYRAQNTYRTHDRVRAGWRKVM